MQKHTVKFDDDTDEPCSSTSASPGSTGSSGPVGGVVIPLLPPCRVCGEKASGLHYGVNTCEACKGFFRRSLQRKTPYKCDKEKECQIGIGRRNSCAHCRLMKCQLVGMSKEAIKTGRYTHAKRTKDIQEVKRLHTEKTKFEGEDEKLRTMSGFKQEYSNALDYTKDMQSFIDALNDRITALGENSIMTPPDLAPHVDKYMEDYMLQMELFGKMQPLSREEYQAFYQSTGIDIDQRRNLVVEWTRMVEIGVRKLIKFAKQLPGFSQVSLADQIALIKAARFEVGLLAIHKRFNVNKECFLSMRGIVRHKTEMLRLWSEPDYLDGLFMVARRLQEMQLSIPEIVLMMGLILFSPDRCALENIPLVESSQKLYLDILQYSFKTNHPGKPNLLGQLFSCLMQLRELSDCNIQMIENLRIDWQHEIKFPDLFNEMTQ